MQRVEPPRGYELEEVGYLTSEQALALPEPPESMVVLGGGVIAVELGQFYARMGTRVRRERTSRMQRLQGRPARGGARRRRGPRSEHTCAG